VSHPAVHFAAGHLDASHTEATDLQCTARLYHQAMDECQRLQSENIALRQMLQDALDTGPTPRARSSSRGRNQAPKGREHASSVVKPGLSFVAEQGRLASCAQGRSCSPLSRSVSIRSTRVYSDDLQETDLEESYRVYQSTPLVHTVFSLDVTSPLS